MLVIQFTNNDMAQDIIKSLETQWPTIEFPSRLFKLAFLLGFYDGEGTAGTTKISSASKAFLDQVKKEFNIPNSVHPKKGGIWYISLGYSLFNEMNNAYKLSMRRKRHNFNPHRINIYNNFKQIMTRELITELVWKMRKKDIASKYNVQVYHVTQLCKEWRIEMPPHGWWIQKEKRKKLKK